MVDRPRAPTSGAPSPDPRTTRNVWKKERWAAIKAAMAVPRVRVTPATEAIRRVLKHPAGMPFRETGSVEWPFDSFTQKRIRDGSVTAEPVETPAQHAGSQPVRQEA
jgi:hypothetical protein